MARADRNLVEKRRILQLETLYDLAVALHAHRPEGELVEELLQRVCAVVDPTAAVAVTRNPGGGVQALSSVGWRGGGPDPGSLQEAPLWEALTASDGVVVRREGILAGRSFRQLLATSLAHREQLFGFLAILDKEARDGVESTFTGEDRRFLESVGALAGVALDSARQVGLLELHSERLEEENRALRGEMAPEVAGQRIIGNSESLRQAIERAVRVAPRSVTVLVRGESGTGKELIARLLHLQSRRTGPLVTINCAALPESLLESELFGIEGGVATGVSARRGKFELADEGTMFLDEVGDLAPSLQVKLLRAVQEREIVRIGGHEPIAIDVRVVAATHQNLEQLVREGTFRDDLYYRLRGIEIQLPPLRERRQDIPLLVRHFATRFCHQERLPEPRFTSGALSLLLRRDYPGNVRELRNLVEAAISLADGAVDEELIRSLHDAGDDEPSEALDLETVERRHIARVLRLTGGNKSEAARILGVHRRTLARKGF